MRCAVTRRCWTKCARRASLGAKLRRHGAVVRGCGNYPGLDETWYRTAVRTQKENEQLLKIMREVLA